MQWCGSEYLPIKKDILDIRKLSGGTELQDIKNHYDEIGSIGLATIEKGEPDLNSYMDKIEVKVIIVQHVENAVCFILEMRIIK